MAEKGHGDTDKKKAKHLLSSNALPRIEIPTSGPHKRRQFKLPDVIGSKPSLDSRGGNAPDSTGDPTEEDKATKADEKKAKKKEGKKARKLKKNRSDKAAASEKSSDVPAPPKNTTGETRAIGKKANKTGENKAVDDQPSSAPFASRGDATGRFRERTLGWFKLGDDLEHDDAFEEPAAGLSTSQWAAVIAVAAVAVVAVLWLITS